jgi:hypothetical protein
VKAAEQALAPIAIVGADAPADTAEQSAKAKRAKRGLAD